MECCVKGDLLALAGGSRRVAADGLYHLHVPTLWMALLVDSCVSSHVPPRWGHDTVLGQSRLRLGLHLGLEVEQRLLIGHSETPAFSRG